MVKKRPPATPADSTHPANSRYAAICMVAVALALTSYMCLSVLTAAGVDVTTGAGAIVAVLLAVSKVCSSLGRR